MYRKLFTLLLLAGQMLAYAEGSALLVTLKNGQTAGYVLSEKPTVTFGDGTLVIRVADASTEYQRADISKFTFVDAGEITGLEKLPEGSTVFHYHDGIVRAEGTSVKVYSLSGRLVKSGTSSVSLAGLPVGTYIVKTGSQVIKIKK